MSERIMITGVKGFIGSRTFDYLQTRLNITDKQTRWLGVDLAPADDQDTDYVRLDLRDSKAVNAVLTTFAPTVVINLGALSTVGEVSDANVDMLKNLLSGVVAAGSTAHVIQAGSAAEYGVLAPDLPPAPETGLLWPGDDPYAQSKVACSRVLHDFGVAHGLPITIMRLANVYGPGQAARVIPRLIHATANGNPFVLNGSGLPMRQYVYIDDIAAAIYAVLRRRKPGVFNFGNHPEVSLRGLADMVVTAVHDHQLVHDIVPKPACFSLGIGNGGAMRVAVDFTKAKRELEWFPVVSLYDGLKRTVAEQLKTGARHANPAFADTGRLSAQAQPI